jgi:hypothetical protein
MLLRTAKSCGPDAPTLASSSRSRVGPTGLRQDLSAGDGGKPARSPGRARRKPLKPLRAGTSGDSGVLVVTRVRSTNTKCTRGRGCNGHPAFPTPSFWAEDSCTPRAHRAARSRTCVWILRHCERSEAIHLSFLVLYGLLRCARNDGAAAMDCFAEPVIGRAFARRTAMPRTSIFRILYNRQSGLYSSRLSTGSDGSQKGRVS